MRAIAKGSVRKAARGSTRSHETAARLLIVDDEPTVVLSLTSFFESQGFEVQGCEDGASALDQLHRKSFDVVLLDLLLPDIHGMEILDEIKDRYPEVAVVIMSAAGTIETAVQAVKAGAEDFFKKPFVLEEASLALQRTLEMRRLQKQNVYYQKLIHDQLPHEMLGTSRAMAEVREFINLMAENAGTMVLLEGESGVGKGLAARAIHARSPRGKGAFVEVNCSSLSETLLESELFGYEKGAFTGATSRKPGLFEVADGGTLFLDEISDMPQAVQPKLLIAIETGSFRRLGSTRDLHSNVRIVASSNRSLKDEVKKGRFRADLYYRLDVMSIEIPPLRTHKTEDIPVLVEHFLNMFTRSRGRAPVEMTEEVADLLVAYDWPGNLRELRNVLERAVILSRGTPIGPQHLPQEMAQETTREPAKSAVSPSRSLDANDLPSLEEVALAHIRRVLEATGHNHSRSARILGLHRTTLLDKIKKHGLEN